MNTVAIAGTFDTKGEEFRFVKEMLENLGLSTLTIHTGVFVPALTPDVSNDEVVKAAGGDLQELLRKKDRATATDALAKGMQILLPRLYKEGRFDGVLSMGGSGGTAIATSGMRRLPVGVPKIMVSTVASGDVSRYVGESDIFMYPSVVDVSGLNSVSRKIYTNAALAMAGMLKHKVIDNQEKKPLIGATMFGVTTPCVDAARRYMEGKGYEVLVFHATGIGGMAMEALVESGYFAGILDFTTTEWCDEIAGGIMAGGPYRLEAAAKKGVPQVISVGALDMVNFGERASIPEKYANRKLYQHNPNITLMRTTVDENRQIGKVIAQKLNESTGPTALMLPLRGVSSMDVPGQPFYGPAEDEALFSTLRNMIDTGKVELIEMNTEINDIAFARTACDKLIEYMTTQESGGAL